MTNIKNALITDILPDSLSDDSTLAIGYALNKVILMMCNYSDNVRVFAMIDNMPEEIIDFLAVELRAQYYDERLSIKQKKGIVKNALSRYRKTGTPSIIKEYLETLNGDVEIKEWFDYNGDPYHFSVYITMPQNQEITEAVIKDVEDKIEKLKNVRSILDEVNIIKQYEAEANESIEVASALVVDRFLGQTDELYDSQKHFTVLLDDEGNILTSDNNILITQEE